MVYYTIVYSTVVYDTIIYWTITYSTIAYRSAFLSIGLFQNSQPFYKAIALVYTCFIYGFSFIDTL